MNVSAALKPNPIQCKGDDRQATLESQTFYYGPPTE